MRICVTGGGGFIGSELIKCLNQLGYENLIIVDDQKKEGLKYSKWLSYEDTDLTYLDEVDFVFHLGANSSTRSTMEEIKYTNIIYPSYLMLNCILRNIPIVFSSSASIYGAIKSKRGKPQTDYANAKLVVEQLFSNNHKNSVCLRYHNVYGATEGNKGSMASIVHKWLDGYFNGKKSNVLFNNSNKIKRDFVNVDDVNKINIMFLDYYIKYGTLPNQKIYDVGTAKAVSFQKLADEIVKYVDVIYEYIPNPFSKANYQFYTKANIKPIREIYEEVYRESFSPLSIEEGIEQTFKKIKQQYEK